MTQTVKQQTVAAFVIVLAGCGPRVSVDDYATDCTSDDECVAIRAPRVCDCDEGFTQAINTASLEDYRDDVRARCDDPCPEISSAVWGECAVSLNRCSSQWARFD